MIVMIDGRRPIKPNPLTDAMYRGRAKTFHDRLKWDVQVTPDGMEIDRFDDLGPLYLISLDHTLEYQGSLRLLPMTGPNMLCDVFPQLLNCELETAIAFERETIWESSRITARSSAAFQDLMVGLAEMAVRARLTALVTVVDTRILRILRASRLTFREVGLSQKVGGVMCHVIWFAEGERSLAETTRHAAE